MENNLECLNTTAGQQVFVEGTREPDDGAKTNFLISEIVPNNISASDPARKATQRRSRSVDIGRRNQTILESRRSRSACSFGVTEIDLRRNGDNKISSQPKSAPISSEPKSYSISSQPKMASISSQPKVAETSMNEKESTNPVIVPNVFMTTSCPTLGNDVTEPDYPQFATPKLSKSAPSMPSKSSKWKWLRHQRKVHPSPQTDPSPRTDSSRSKKRSNKKSSNAKRYFFLPLAHWSMLVWKPLAVMTSPLMNFM
uniref:uncharacterized protein LOC120338774 n=1 Tax=Styela clava TaxID=7725 RepID=UPI00193A47F1|nr:uncharacterized protein LOC120338774 [Styela clava]